MLRLRALWFTCGSAILWYFSSAVFAQAPASQTFEVASVKPNNMGGGALVYLPPGGLLRMINVPLSDIIRRAYQVPEDQVIGPDWIRTSRFDVLAKTPNSLPVAWDGPSSIRLMWRA